MSDIKVFLDYKLNDSGKGKFLKRLIPELENIGVSVRRAPKGCDVALGIVYWKTKVKMPKVLRIDGIQINRSNKKILKNMNASDAVIYQSKFAKRYIEKRLKIKCKKKYVIYNGANPDDYSHCENRQGYLMAANWGSRKHKRLNVHEAFAAFHPELECLIAGKCDLKSTANLRVLGQLNDVQLREYQSKCSHFVYLADLDWCPNVVVEAIVAGMKVVHDPSCKAVNELVSLPKKELLIQNTARKYKAVFNELRRQ